MSGIGVVEGGVLACKTHQMEGNERSVDLPWALAPGVRASSLEGLASVD